LKKILNNIKFKIFIFLLIIETFKGQPLNFQYNQKHLCAKIHQEFHLRIGKWIEKIYI